jgi:hypothetical protein
MSQDKPIDITSLRGADLLAALTSSTPVKVENKRGRKKAAKAANGSPAKARTNGTAPADLLTPIERDKLLIRRLVEGMPDREWIPLSIDLLVHVTTCLGCGGHFESPHCEVPMLRVKSRRKNALESVRYIRLDSRIPNIHRKLPKRIQRQQRFTYTCPHCFEETE